MAESKISKSLNNNVNVLNDHIIIGDNYTALSNPQGTVPARAQLDPSGIFGLYTYKDNSWTRFAYLAPLSTTAVNFTNNPTTYLFGGQFYIIRVGFLVILRFVDIKIHNSPTGGTILYSDIPKPIYEVSTLLHSYSNGGMQKISVTDTGLSNYWTNDDVRKSTDSLFHGEIIYFAK